MGKLKEKLKKIGNGVLKVLALATQIFKIYKLFTRGGNCDREKDEREREQHQEKDTDENSGKKER